MKQRISTGVFIAILAVVVLVAAFFGWRVLRGTDYRSITDDAFAKAERDAKAQGKDIRNDPMLAPLYYQRHPEEKPPAGQEPNPLQGGPPSRISDPSGAPLAPSPPKAPGE